MELNDWVYNEITTNFDQIESINHYGEITTINCNNPTTCFSRVLLTEDRLELNNFEYHEVGNTFVHYNPFPLIDFEISINEDNEYYVTIGLIDYEIKLADNFKI